jgi:hypothetical protein
MVLGICSDPFTELHQTSYEQRGVSHGQYPPFRAEAHVHTD